MTQTLGLIAAIADHLPVGVWVARAPDGAFVYSNRAFTEIMGMGPEPEAHAGAYAEPYGIFDREGRPYPEARMPFVRALERKAMTVVDDIVIHRRDGRRVFIRAYAQPMFAEDGSIAHVAIAFIDITAEVRTSEQLDSVLAAVPVVLFAIDRAGTITVSEGRGLERMGFRPKELVGRNVFELYRDRPEFLEHARRALAGESFTVSGPVGAGTFETASAPQRDGAGNVVGMVGISTDITERTEMQRRLVEVERLAAMGILAATVAHEINNPLTYVLANLEVLSARVDKLGPALGPVASTRSMLGDIREGAERVRRIVRDLKAFSREDDHVEPTDVTTVLERAVVLAGSELRHRARLVRDYRPVPVVAANEARLGQVFLNLLVNAAQAIPEGAPDANEIRLRVHSEGGAVLVEVEDTGHGMDDAISQRIFEPFFTTKSAHNGTGLGLSVCRTIVERFGGSISVASTEGEGTVLRVRLPVSGATATTAPPTPEPQSPRRLRLLVIDDDERVASALRCLLSDAHDVDIETDPERALVMLLGDARYDLILCDVMMPRLSGLELHDAVAAKLPEVARRMVFVSGGVSSAALARIEDRLLEKPVDRRTLDRVIRSFS